MSGIGTTSGRRKSFKQKKTNLKDFFDKVQNIRNETTNVARNFYSNREFSDTCLVASKACKDDSVS